MSDYIKQIEETDGLRCVFNIFPTKATELPLTVLYTPSVACNTLPYEPLYCPTCRSLITPACILDFVRKTWTCLFCQKIINFPPHYKEISEEHLPQELIDTTVEYQTNRKTSPPVFIFVIDTSAFDEERHEILQEGVRIVYDSLPSDSLVCFLTFGTNIELLKHTDSGIKVKYVFSYKSVYTNEELYKFITGEDLVKDQSGRRETAGFDVSLRSHTLQKSLVDFLFTIKENHVFPTIKRDPFPVLTGQRPLRCTGAALSLAIQLCDINSGAKILLFTQGPCTFGQGAITSLALKDGIRSHTDIIKGKASHSESAKAFYNKLAQQAVDKSIAIDILALTIEDIGLYEMRPIADRTGGFIVMAQDFNRNVFISSLKKLFSEEQVLDAKFKILVSKNLSFKGVVGLGSQYPSGWRVNALHPTSNFSFIFEPVNAKSEEDGIIQIVTRYQKENKSFIKVTTFKRKFSDDIHHLIDGFDQEAACVLTTRMCTMNNCFEEDLDLVRRIDRGLVRFTKKYAQYSKEQPSSVTLADEISLYPKFIYFLRRSAVVHSETSSPDETSYYRYIILREGVTEAMTMIVPVLICYHYNEGVFPVDMDSTSLRQDVILLLDAYSTVCIWNGEYVNGWIKEKIHEQEEYKALNECIVECKERAMKLIEKRSPTPMFYETGKGQSQERHLLARVNPSKSGAEIATEDIDYKAFFDFLCDLIVQ